MADPVLPDFNEQRWDLELSAAVLDTSRRADGRAPIQVITATPYTLDLTDEGNVIEMNLTAANELFVPPEVSVPFPVGSTIYIRQVGTGLTTVKQGTGVLIRYVSHAAPYPLVGQWAEAVLSKRAGDEWVISGAIS